MAPKNKAKGDNATAVDESIVAECKRLQDLAYEGMLSKTRRMCTEEVQPSKVLTKADGKDIVKKSSVRKGRYLLNINARISALAAGRMGSLAQLDSRTPVMYIDFPEGRLKFFGTLMFPSNKYMILRFGAKDIMCEDVLESMVVFSDAWWIGKKDDNPSEAKLPLPQHLIDAGVKAAAAADDACTQEKANGKLSQAAQTHKRPPRENGDITDDSDAGDDDDATANGGDGNTQEGRRMSQRSANKRPRYNVDASDDDEEDEEHSGSAGGHSDGMDAPMEQPQRQRLRSIQEESGLMPAASQEEEEEDADQGSGRSQPKPEPSRKRARKADTPASQSAPSPAVKRKQAAKKALRAASEPDSEDGADVIDLCSSPKASQSQRPVRAAASARKASLKEAPSDEDDQAGASEEQESEEDDDDDDFEL